MPNYQNITALREDQRNAQAQLEAARQTARNLLSNPNATTAEMNAAGETITNMEARVNLYNQQIAAAEAAAGSNSGSMTPMNTGSRELRDILGSNEYARAFAHAISHGMNPRNARGVDRYHVLFDAMTIGGGDPAGSDGGFLVPVDIQNQIHEITRTLNPLADLFNRETVTAPTGWRPMDAAPTTGMAEVDEMGQVQAGEQPSFAKVPYALKKYGMFIPISNELASDEVANLFSYLARWFAKKAVITENILLKTKLAGISATAIASGSELAGIKKALNVALDPAISANATILTNQSGFDVLDNLTDNTGRPLLHTDPTTKTPMLLNSRPVHVVTDAVLPNTGNTAPVYIGDFKQYATLFERNPLEIVSTDIGGSAFRTDSIEVRGIKRMGVSVFDTAAVVARTLALPTT